MSAGLTKLRHQKWWAYGHNVCRPGSSVVPKKYHIQSQEIKIAWSHNAETEMSHNLRMKGVMQTRLRMEILKVQRRTSADHVSLRGYTTLGVPRIAVHQMTVNGYSSYLTYWQQNMSTSTSFKHNTLKHRYVTALLQQWTDERLRWDPSRFNQQTSITMSSDAVWTPGVSIDPRSICILSSSRLCVYQWWEGATPIFLPLPSVLLLPLLTLHKMT